MFKKITFWIFEIVLVIIFLLMIVAHSFIIYGASQGIGQFTIIIKAQPIQDVMRDESFPDSLKQKLALIQEIKKFAIDSLGFKGTKNYTTVYNQNNKSILLTITACEPYHLKAKEWWFPIIGKVSYIGYFNKKEARKEIEFLKEKDFDVNVYSPSGWSTLGWFNDPIQSNMLKQSEGNLANLIIHELTHGVLFVKSNVTFNENLASFIGDKGAEEFLKIKYGEHSKERRNYNQSKHDEQIYKNYMLNGTNRLDSLYNSFTMHDLEQIKKRKKSKLIADIVIGVDHLPLEKRKNYFNYSLNAFFEGNTFVMSFRRYDSQNDVFEKEFAHQFHANLRLYIDEMKKRYTSL